MNYKEYIKEFNKNDTEYIKTEISNDSAEGWLESEIPKFECSNKTIEKTYYFRWWTFRKHIKKTPEGYAVTEFLPKVPWSGIYNVINAPVGHHLMEGRWLKNAQLYLKDYIDIFFNHDETGMKYSTWLIYAAYKLNEIKGFLDKDFLEKAKAYYVRWEEAHKTDSGLFWSKDNYDAMEYSISGTFNDEHIPGIRPTLNSYMYADALAIYNFSKNFGEPLEIYLKKAQAIKSKMKELLFRDGFFRAIHPKDGNFKNLEKFDTGSVPRELIGFIPWYFNMYDEDFGIFELLEDENAFAVKEGLATAERSSDKFLYEANHECLWNGYVWPFATAQTLTALLNVTKNSNGEKKEKYSDMFLRILDRYAAQHTRVCEDGREVMWIDEVKSPYENVWTSRELLKQWGWPENKGGFERGKDYNHSSFCDIVISAFSGAETKNGAVTFNPVIPDQIDYFKLDDLYILGDRYTVSYDKTGTHYGKKGFFVLKNGKKI